MTTSNDFLDSLKKHQKKPVALVTGASKRIGKSIAEVLHSKGFDVIIHYHSGKEDATLLVQNLNMIRPDSASCFSADLCNLEELHQMTSLIKKAHIDLHTLVNNASVFIKDSLSWENDFNTLFAIHVKAPLALAYELTPLLKKYKGSIVNITDIHAEKPLKGYGIYCQSKATLNMQTKTLGISLAPDIRVNAVAPGSILWPEGNNMLTQDIKNDILQKIPLHCHGEARYIADTVLHLIQHPYITGQIIAVDGGRLLR